LLQKDKVKKKIRTFAPFYQLNDYMRYVTRISLVWMAAFLWTAAGTKEIQFTEGIQTGNLAPEIKLQDIELKGNGLVLLQFWSASDPQSRLENAQMHHAASQLGAENLRFVSISFDDPAVFQGIVKADRLDVSNQWNDPQGNLSPVFRQYRLKNGYGNRLIDSHGVIIAKNLRPSELSAFL
jgi:hypothetical protein